MANSEEKPKQNEVQSATVKTQQDQLEWIEMCETIKAMGEHESFKDKLIRRTKENPLVPIGVLATATALSFGLRAMKSGNRRQSQIMMRFRIGAQGFTIAAIIIGIGIGASKSSVPSTS